jgi:hypothetical protein
LTIGLAIAVTELNTTRHESSVSAPVSSTPAARDTIAVRSHTATNIAKVEHSARLDVAHKPSLRIKQNSPFENATQRWQSQKILITNESVNNLKNPLTL